MMIALVIAALATAALAGWWEFHKMNRVAGIAFSVIAKQATTIELAKRCIEEDGMTYDGAKGAYSYLERLTMEIG